MYQLTFSDLDLMPCPFYFGDVILYKPFNQKGYIIRIFGDFLDFQILGISGVSGMRYARFKECVLISKCKDQEFINFLILNHNIYFSRIRRFDLII